MESKQGNESRPIVWNRFNPEYPTIEITLQIKPPALQLEIVTVFILVISEAI